MIIILLLYLFFQAIDLDEGVNAKVNYYLLGDVKETLTEGLENLAVSPFLVNIETGAISLNFDPQKGMKGYFDFKVGKNSLFVYNSLPEMPPCIEITSKNVFE